MKYNSRFVEEKIENGKTIETVRFDTTKKYTQRELKTQREQFSKDAQAGKIICLTDLMINHGM